MFGWELGAPLHSPNYHSIKLEKNTKKPGQFLDNPSVYLGGNMGDQETDFGLAWEVIREKMVNYLKKGKLFVRL
ncbi:hypothetical protein NXX54_26070 [Bacteroides sp. BFG-638]|uniref:hypothetical protein n=1 Tax=Bacteroides sp. BFG-638 TaxID=2972765 RepID=UPI0021665DE3|nr:hypothetical protein [Bacteroides sp. BFG-638]MCS2951608.1 hypothetical protein [Bacteroides sp. BFG-638]